MVGAEPLEEVVGEALLERIDRWLWQASLWVSVLAIVGVLVLVSMQVVNRHIRSNPLVWTEELARAGLVWMTFFGAAALTGQGRHIALDVIAGRMSPKAQRRLEGFEYAVVFVAVAAFLPSLIDRMIRMSELSASASGVSMFIFVGPSAIAFSLVAVHSLLRLVRFARSSDAAFSKKGGDPDLGRGI